jgi:hypothetical protein
MSTPSDAQKREHREQANDLLAVMGTPAGRRFVYRILEKSHMFQTSFTGNSQTFFREGERNIGLFLFNELMVECPELYVTAQNEHRKRVEEKTNGR